MSGLFDGYAMGEGRTAVFVTLEVRSLLEKTREDAGETPIGLRDYRLTKHQNRSCKCRKLRKLRKTKGQKGAIALLL